MLGAMDSIHGVTLEQLAELARWKDILDEAAFAKHLGGEGLSVDDFQKAWNGWMDLFLTDAKLEARFAQLRHGRTEAETEFDEHAPTKKSDSPFVTDDE
jgi:hypothetical protein